MCVRYGLKQLIFKMIAGKSNDNRHETQGENREITLKKNQQQKIDCRNAVNTIDYLAG